MQRLVNRLRRRSQPPLQDRERKTDGSDPIAVIQGLGTVKLLAHIVRDRFVEMCFGVRKFVRNGVCDAFWKKRGAVELEQVLLYHPSHQVRDV